MTFILCLRHPTDSGRATLRAGSETLEALSKRQVDDVIRQSAKAIDGQLHHMIPHSGAKGDVFRRLLENAGLDPALLDDAINKIPLPGHVGRHTDGYHDLVLRELTEALDGTTGPAAQEAFESFLAEFRDRLIQNPRLPYQ